MIASDQIKAALDRAAATVTQKPSVGQRVYVSTATVTDGLSCRVQEKHHALVADLPSSMGGENLGPSPSALMRAALSSCIAMGVKMWGARMNVAIDRVDVRVETDVDARGQFGVADEISPGFENFRIHIDITSDADTETLREVVRVSQRYSPLLDALRAPQAIATNLVIRQPEGAL